LQDDARSELRDDSRATRADAARAEQAAPLVSVVVPAYDCAAFISETLDSVFAQTLKDFEVVVVNDGSPDTVELERSLAPYLSRVNYVRQENRGAGAARNRGIREARGEFVAFLDGDDVWTAPYLERQLKFIEESGYDLAYADALLFGDSPDAGKTYMQTAPSEGPVTFLSLIRGECNVITSGVVARRQLVVEAGAFDESLRNSQDFELWARLARGGARIGYQREALLRYRCRASGRVSSKGSCARVCARKPEPRFAAGPDGGGWEGGVRIRFFVAGLRGFKLIWKVRAPCPRAARLREWE
jgi:glycosyltransferase involved in cell wall biosynthesis